MIFHKLEKEQNSTVKFSTWAWRNFDVNVNKPNTITFIHHWPMHVTVTLVWTVNEKAQSHTVVHKQE